MLYTAQLDDNDYRRVIAIKEQFDDAEYHHMTIKAYANDADLQNDTNYEVVFDGERWTGEKPDFEPKSELWPVITFPMWEKFVKPLRSLMEQTMQPAMKVVTLSGASSKAVNQDFQDFLDACDYIDGYIDQFKQENPDSWPEE